MYCGGVFQAVVAGSQELFCCSKNVGANSGDRVIKVVGQLPLDCLD
jgi:hypothetical protein